MKFKTGFLLGAIAGVAYGLLTAKKTGPQRLQSMVTYSDDLTHATTDVQHAVTRFGHALSDLKQEIQTTLAPNLKDITDSATDFAFQTEAHTKAMQAHLDTIAEAMADINAAAADPKPVEPVQN